ncbi:MAG TPA: FAD-dependent oxidoreductase [Burkholderiaceae bacterium]|jgi:3-(3-hydroxy-phenyl)propionate hydroxylase|nr:FAD-dependent oxidoreductase [Burkholderiaceae bacterium]
MHSAYTYPRYEFRTPPELAQGPQARYPVVVVGAGPVGLATAIDLAQQGVSVVLLDEDETVSLGSRGLCYAKRTIEVLDRLGVGDAVVDKGVTWNLGRTFFRDEEVYRFNLLPDADHRRPGMINLQQYYLEQFLVERAQSLAPTLDLRWKTKVVGVHAHDTRVLLEVETPEGAHSLEAQWLVACDGARSSLRRTLGLDVQGRVFQDRFLIADVVMKADFPPERWFWFDPPFHPNQSVLLHREADNVWRIDFQLGWDADPEIEKQPERVIPRIRAMLGPEREFELEWVSVYTFQCRRMQKFRHARVLFAGDAAHQVSPFGARGANSGIQDADNLAWKLRLVLDGVADEALLDTYSDERVFAAEENLRNSTRSTDFITPKSATSRRYRNAVLTLAREHAFARVLANSGRLSVPTFLRESALNTPDEDEFEGRMFPGAPADDAPVEIDGQDGWLLSLLGNRFQVLLFAGDAIDLQDVGLPEAQALQATLDPRWRALGLEAIYVTQGATAVAQPARVAVDHRGVAARRFDAKPGTVVLLRPDQHVCARWRRFDSARLDAALRRACAVR